MTLVTDTNILTSLCAQFRREPYVTIDTEFMRDRTYYPKLCLVQLAGTHDAVVVDALAPGLDLTPLLDLMDDPSVVKVFHACRQDLEIFYHMTGGRLPRPVFDTQIAAMVCGFGEEVGYETLVSKVAKGKLDKSSRLTDWSKRPLSSAQINYALGDVTHLRVIYERLLERIERAGRLAWVEEELTGLSNPSLYVTQPADAWKRLKLRSRLPRFVALVQELAAWREVKCKERDVPRNRIVRDDLLLELAAQKPTTYEDLKRLDRINLDRDSGHQVVAVISEVLSRNQDDLPNLPAPSQPPRGIGPVIDLLRVLLKRCSEDHDVAARLIATTSDLEQLASKDEPEIRAMHGWRREIFGEAALRLKTGRTGLAIDGRQLRLVDLDNPTPE